MVAYRRFRAAWARAQASTRADVARRRGARRLAIVRIQRLLDQPRDVRETEPARQKRLDRDFVGRVQDDRPGAAGSSARYARPQARETSRSGGSNSSAPSRARSSDGSGASPSAPDTKTRTESAAACR